MSVEELLEALPSEIVVDGFPCSLGIFKIEDDRYHACYHGSYWARGKGLKNVLTTLYEKLQTNKLI